MDTADNPSGTNFEAPVTDWRAIDWDAHKGEIGLSDGTRFSFVDYGSGTGTPLLLIHGLGGSWQVWLENIAPLARDRRVVAVDLPGFGDSPHRPEMLTFDQFAAAVVELCAALRLTSVALVGNSLGGWICAEIARTNPALTSALVLVDAAGLPPTKGERARALATLRIADRLIPWSCRNRELLARRPKLRKHALAFAITRGDLLSPDLALHLLPPRPSPAFRPVLETAFKTWSSAWCDSLEKLQPPTLIVWGELDRQLPLRHATQWARHIPAARLEVIGGAGHLPMVESPTIFNDHVEKFLSECVDPPDLD